MLIETLGDTKDMAYAAAAAFSAAAGAVHDLKSRRIPNLLTAASLLCGLGLHLALDGLRGAGGSLLAGLAGGGVFLVFYLAGGMGAGDLKLMAAVGCLAGFLPLERILIATALAGALMAMAIALRHGRLAQTVANTWVLAAHHRAQGLAAHGELHQGNAGALRMPFAVPIAAGCVASLSMQLLRMQMGKG